MGRPHSRPTPITWINLQDFLESIKGKISKISYCFRSPRSFAEWRHLPGSCPPPVLWEVLGPAGRAIPSDSKSRLWRDSLERAGFSRGFSAALRSRLPLRKDTGWTRENPFPPGFLIHRSPRRAILAGENWGWASFPVALIFEEGGSNI